MVGVAVAGPGGGRKGPGGGAVEAGFDAAWQSAIDDRVLWARLRALVRGTRRAPAPPPALTLGGLRIDLQAALATVDGRLLRLTRTQFELLACLAAQPGIVVSRSALLRVLSAALDYVRSGGKVQRDEARVLAGFGRSVLDCWKQPDNGIWEIRGGRRDYTLSKVWCWVALDCLLELQQRGIIKLDAARARAGREQIAHIIESRGFNPQLSSYVQTLDGDRVDAGLLLMSCLGYKDPNDARMRGTYDRIRQRLGRDELLYRYESDVDRLPPGEGAFGICSFWAIDYLVGRGDLELARRMFERMIARASDLGLFAEEIDPENGAQLGNFPQAFTHVGVIFAALSLARRERNR